MKMNKNIVWMASFAIAATTFGACSNEDDNLEQKDKAIVITATLPAMSGSSTRGLSTTDPGDGTLNAEWEVNDEIYVSYQTSADPTYSSAKAKVNYVNPTTKAATITFTAPEAMDGGDFSFGYPYNYYDPNGKDWDMSAQLGTLDDIRDNYDIFYGDGTISNGGTTFTLAAGMYRETNIFKITVSDGTHDLTSNVTSFVINNGSCTVTPTSQNPIYVAVHQSWTTSDQDIDFEATVTGTYAGTYSCTKHIKEYSSGFPVGKLFTINLVMSPPLNLTSPAVGQVIGSDGKNYAYASLPGSVTAVAMICYVSGDHGLALALTDEGTMDWSAAVSTCAAHTPAFTGGAWKLATEDEWNNMISAAGNSQTLRDGFSSVGGSNLQFKGYWSSTDSTTPGYAKVCFFDNNPGWNGYSKNYANYFIVRACLAF